MSSARISTTLGEVWLIADKNVQAKIKEMHNLINMRTIKLD
jgi:hypothetical protein